jgi:hypothetical protein
MQRSEQQFQSRADEGITVRNFKLVVCAICVSVLAQTPARITPEPPVGKGTIVLKVARLIDGTGAV